MAGLFKRLKVSGIDAMILVSVSVFCAVAAGIQNSPFNIAIVIGFFFWGAFFTYTVLASLRQSGENKDWSGGPVTSFVVRLSLSFIGAVALEIAVNKNFGEAFLLAIQYGVLALGMAYFFDMFVKFRKRR